MRTLGAVLAGGRSSRFGSDKAEAIVKGRTLLAHALDAIRPLCDEVIVVGRTSSLAASIADQPMPGLGPLGGVAGALSHAKAHDFGQVLSVPVDCLVVPADLRRLLEPAPAYLADLPVIGLWPTETFGTLEEMLRSEGNQAMRRFAGAIDARPVAGVSPVSNLNTPGDLAAWEREHG